MDAKRFYLGTPGPSALGLPVADASITPPGAKNWIIREILVVHHGTQGTDPPGYVTVSAGPVGVSLGLAQWQANALMWATGPHYPISEPTAYPFYWVLRAGENLAFAQFYRALDGTLTEASSAADSAHLYLNIAVTGLEVDAY